MQNMAKLHKMFHFKSHEALKYNKKQTLQFQIKAMNYRDFFLVGGVHFFSKVVETRFTKRTKNDNVRL